jgi:DNA-binding Lrp family transcriptional regulator
MNRAGELDDVDLGIIDQLRREPRMSNRTLAKAVGVSVPTLYSRLGDLHDQHVCEVRAQLDFGIAGYHRLAFLDLHVSARPMEEVAEDVSRLRECTGLMLFNDDPKIVAAVLAQDDAHLCRLVSTDLAAIPGITRITVHVALRLIRYGAEYGEIGVDRHEPLPRLDGSLISDPLDNAILETLRNDARLSNRQVARELNVSESSVRKRLARLFDMKALKFTLVCSPGKLGQKVWGYVRLALPPRLIKSVIELLSANIHVDTMYEVSGPWPIHFFGTFPDDETFRALISSILEHVDHDANLSAREFRSAKHNCDYVKII